MSDYTLNGKTLRKGKEAIAVNPFTPEEQWITVEEFAARQIEMGELVQTSRGMRIGKIDMATKTVTLEAE